MHKRKVKDNKIKINFDSKQYGTPEAIKAFILGHITDYLENHDKNEISGLDRLINAIRNSLIECYTVDEIDPILQNSLSEFADNALKNDWYDPEVNNKLSELAGNSIIQE